MPTKVNLEVAALVVCICLYHLKLLALLCFLVSFHCNTLCAVSILYQAIYHSNRSLDLLVQKVDKMFSAFTGQPLEKVQQYTERDRFLSVSEVTVSSGGLKFKKLFATHLCVVFFFKKKTSTSRLENRLLD